MGTPSRNFRRATPLALYWLLLLILAALMLYPLLLEIGRAFIDRNRLSTLWFQSAFSKNPPPPRVCANFHKNQISYQSCTALRGHQQTMKMSGTASCG